MLYSGPPAALPVAGGAGRAVLHGRNHVRLAFLSAATVFCQTEFAAWLKRPASARAHNGVERYLFLLDATFRLRTALGFVDILAGIVVDLILAGIRQVDMRSRR